MSPAIIPTVPPVTASDPAADPAPEPPRPASVNRHGDAAPQRVNGVVANASVPHAVIDKLAVYIAGPGERESVAELVRRAGTSRPRGALMVAAVDGKLLAAGSMSDGEVVSEPSPSGSAAAAVVRYRLASLRRRRHTPRVPVATS